jgi:hypothetical protein
VSITANSGDCGWVFVTNPQRADALAVLLAAAPSRLVSRQLLFPPVRAIGSFETLPHL